MGNLTNNIFVSIKYPCLDAWRLIVRKVNVIMSNCLLSQIFATRNKLNGFCHNEIGQLKLLKITITSPVTKRKTLAIQQFYFKIHKAMLFLNFSMKKNILSLPIVLYLKNSYERVNRQGRNVLVNFCKKQETSTPYIRCMYVYK